MRFAFEEEAAASIPHELTRGEFVSEERNQPWEQAMLHLTRYRRFSNYHYYGSQFGGVWTPKDLRRGQIVRCNLPTDYNLDGKPTLNPRNCIFLGFDVDPETLEPIAARLCRLSYNTEQRNPTYEPVWTHMDPEIHENVIGGFYKPAVVRAGSPIDIVPFNSLYWGHFIDVGGEIKPSYFSKLEDILDTGFEEARQFTGVRNYADIPVDNSYFLPSLDPQFLGKQYDFELDEEIGTDYYDIGYNFDGRAALDNEDDGELTVEQEELDRISGLLEEKQFARDLVRGDLFHDSWRLKNAFAFKKARNAEVVQQMVREFREKYGHLGKSALARIQEIARQRVNDADDRAAHQWAEEQQKPKPAKRVKKGPQVTLAAIADIPDIAKIIEESHAQWSAENDTLERARAAVAAQAIDNTSLKSLEDLGIGGLLPKSQLLPEHLWRGRYLMLRIPSLSDPKQKFGQAFRPCALWRAWVRPDERGNLYVSHLELHPCTRKSAGDFKYKMPVRPLDTLNRKPGHLIGDMSVIIEVNKETMPDMIAELGRFYELLPHQVEELGRKRALAEQERGALKTFGLRECDLPADCIEIQLPGAPEERLRERLSRWKGLRFVGGKGKQNPHRSRQATKADRRRVSGAVVRRERRAEAQAQKAEIPADVPLPAAE